MKDSNGQGAIAPIEPKPLELPQPYVSPVYSPGRTNRDSGLGDYWRLLQKHRWTILATVLTVVALTTVASFRMTPLYEGSARIAISKENQDNLGLKEAQVDWSYDQNVELDTQARILQSSTLALIVIDELQLGKNPAFLGSSAKSIDKMSATSREAMLLSIWSKNLLVSKIPRTRLIEIRFLSADPVLAAQVVNTLSSVYVERNFRTRFESTMQASEWLTKQLSDLQLKMETTEDALIRYQKSHNLVGLEDKDNITNKRLDELNREATMAQVDRMQKESAYRMILSGDLNSIPELSGNLLIQRFREQEGDLNKRLAEATTQFGPSYPRVVELQNQLKQIQATIASEVDRIASRKKQEFRAAQDRERMLQAALEAQKVEATQVNEKAIEYNVLKREADANRDLYESLQSKLKEAGVTAGLKSSNVSEVDKARTPDRPSRPNIPRNIALGFLLGIVGGVALALTLEALDNTVRTPEQVELIVSLPSLGVIPLSLEQSTRTSGPDKQSNAIVLQTDAKKYNMSLISYARPKSEIAESYRALRTSILLSSIGAPPKVILLTSALPQEGKTTTSVNTAIVLAQKGARVLLVDADLRRPSVHHSFRIRNRAGLSTLLTGSNTFEELVVQSGIMPNLHILAAGPPPPHPAELLTSSTMKEYMARWRKEYDHIVIDTPPVLSVTDAVSLSVEADSVVLVIRSAQTTKEALRRSRDLLLQVNAKLMGIVVNAVDLQSPDAYYYYYGANYGASRYYDESAITTK